jgi:hypothetical protein
MMEASKSYLKMTVIAPRKSVFKPNGYFFANTPDGKGLSELLRHDDYRLKHGMNRLIGKSSVTGRSR